MFNEVLTNLFNALRSIIGIIILLVTSILYGKKGAPIYYWSTFLCKYE
ncbi:hypothetical protein MUG87_11710 [Ectobacillus sp. JY-23]|nr:hypothetical protein [Ectobacillus sp. JY-23]UOY91221.1 hypothetical protein MUG87_11710 [Ectobacillus sp. JY-23]